MRGCLVKWRNSWKALTVLLWTGLGAFPARAAHAQPVPATRYQPTWSSIDRRPVPAWFADAKFGIFIHWGVYSVPAWAPKGKYSEWYWWDLHRGGPTAQFHKKMFGEAFRYQDFAPQFKAEMFDPARWAELFRKSGAKYVVLTSKHHDGFALWPSKDAWNWNAVDIGPHRDLAGDLSQAVKAQGLKMGFYYSLYEWFHPLYKQETLGRYVDEHMLPQMKDLVTRYQPSILWTDGEWEHPSAAWKSLPFLTWLFNESPVKSEIAVNDRWGKETRGKHGGHYTTEYGSVHPGQALSSEVKRQWEECRGIGASFGFSRREEVSEYATARALVHLIVETVSRGGNLLLDVGPTADGRVPVIMEERLLEIGAWLDVNGEAIYSTRGFRTKEEGKLVRYTRKGDAVYAITLGWPGNPLVLTAPKAKGAVAATLLGRSEPLKVRAEGGKIVVEVPPLSVDEVPARHAYVFKLRGVE